MSRSRKKRDSMTPSLFPFLAVLLCTMGALVLLLMLIVAGAQTTAQTIAKEREERIEEVESKLKLASYSFDKRLNEGRIALEKKRLALQHLESHIQELLRELTQLQRTAELAEEETATDDAAQKQTSEAISELEKQLLEAKEQLKQKLEKPDGTKPIFAIIPYAGPNGTHRRPIYLECTDDGVCIQPEGVWLRDEDLNPPYGPGNPLDAALRTIRAQYVPANLAVTSTAYPLLIVRPSGIRSYAKARAAMSGWDDQFGYELVGEDLELTFPDGEPGLKSKIAQALELARQRQAALVMAMPKKYRQFADEDSIDGGFGDGFGSTSGGGSGRGYGDGPSGDRRTGTGSELAGSGSSSRGGISSDGMQSGQLGGSGKGNGNFDASYGSSPQLAQGTFGSGGGSFGAGESSQADAMSMSSTSSSRNSYEDSQQTPDSRQNAADSNSFFGSSGAWSDSSSSNGQTSSSSPGQIGSDPSGTLAGSPDDSGQTSGSSSGNGGASSGSGGQQMNMSGSPVSMSINAGGQTTSAGQNAANQSAQMQASGMPASAQQMAEQFDGQLPDVMLNQSLMKSNRNENATPVAKRLGRGWAWSQGPPTQTPVVRAVNVRCLNDRWIVLPDSGVAAADSQTISFDESPEVRAEKLARVIADRVDGWGMALTGGYWKPVLVVEVAPDAAWRYEQLRQLLDGSGLDLQLRKN